MEGSTHASNVIYLKGYCGDRQVKAAKPFVNLPVSATRVLPPLPFVANTSPSDCPCTFVPLGEVVCSIVERLANERSQIDRRLCL